MISENKSRCYVGVKLYENIRSSKTYDIVEFSVLFDIYYDARSYKRQTFHYVLFFKITIQFYPVVNSC
jgi:hypothetical protein